jgi:hypothetical protein
MPEGKNACLAGAQRPNIKLATGKALTLIK